MHVMIIGKRRGHEFERAKRGTWEGLGQDGEEEIM